MNYKESLFFIGKCLTVNHEEHNKILVEEQLKSNNVNWDNVVKVSTTHLVFPALYCNLKRANFLHYLPSDLVEYMQHITQLNRERNEQIIKQAKEINELLLANNITPIFLKGTAFLLQGLYEDIAERMVGDIDFLIKKENIHKANILLINNKYKTLTRDLHEGHRHLARLIRIDRIGALEIHKEMLTPKASKRFNFKTIINRVWTKNNAAFLSIQDQVQLSSLALQINDNGYFLNKIALRTSYDIFLNYLKADTKITVNNTLKEQINSYLSVTSKVLNSKKIQFDETEKTKNYTIKTINQVHLKKATKKILLRKRIWITDRFKILTKSLYNRSYRKFVISRFNNKNWLKENSKTLFKILFK